MSESTTSASSSSNPEWGDDSPEEASSSPPKLRLKRETLRIYTGIRAGYGRLQGATTLLANAASQGETSTIFTER